MPPRAPASRSSRSGSAAVVLLALLALPSRADEAGSVAARAWQDYRDIYAELVGTDTTLATGSCTLAAQKMAAHLRAAGWPARDLEVFAVPDHPREGGLLAVLHGRSPGLKALLLVAHIDVVDVRREDWSRDPFTLTEADGYFYGRGVSDNKAMAAALVDSLIRHRRGAAPPRRDIRIALTCGEENVTAFNGARYLAQERRASLDADLVLVPSGGARLDSFGRPTYLTIQVGEKIQQNFDLETRFAGGHASRPIGNDAIARLARGLARLADYEFPIAINAPTRAHFAALAALESGALRTALERLAREPDDAAAAQIVARADPGLNSMMRTTCATTLLQGGEALNALAQRARATLNCRILPDKRADDVRRTLQAVLADASISIVPLEPAASDAVAPQITAAVLRPARAIAASIWPGVAVIPAMLTGATDARHFNAVGIPAYGITALFNDPDGNGVHAQDERVRVRSVREGREYLHRLIWRYANRP